MPIIYYVHRDVLTAAEPQAGWYVRYPQGEPVGPFATFSTAERWLTVC